VEKRTHGEWRCASPWILPCSAQATPSLVLNWLWATVMWRSCVLLVDRHIMPVSLPSDRGRNKRMFGLLNKTLRSTATPSKTSVKAVSVDLPSRCCCWSFALSCAGFVHQGIGSRRVLQRRTLSVMDVSCVAHCRSQSNRCIVLRHLQP
jgi:hypothetical protein